MFYEKNKLFFERRFEAGASNHVRVVALVGGIYVQRVRERNRSDNLWRTGPVGYERRQSDSD
jgi:hypothetical protein